MSDFLQNYRVAITPLTPIHIGCGMDFEPTNYVIRDNNILYSFAPENAELNEGQKQKLLQLGERGDISSIQRFFRDNANTFASAAKRFMPVTNEIAQDYRENVGKVDKNGVSNQLIIQRTTTHPHKDDPYLPGSSVKGAIRTAILDRLNDPPIPYLGNTSRQMYNKPVGSRHNRFRAEKTLPSYWPAKEAARLEQELLGMRGRNYAQSAFRLVKISDMQAHGEPARLVVMTRQYKKWNLPSKTIHKVKDGELSIRHEIITPAQYRCFTGEIQIGTLGGMDENGEIPPHKHRISINAIAHDCNRYYCSQLTKDLDILERRRLASDKWLGEMRKLFSTTGEVSRKLNNGTAFLIRLGMLGGAESKTFRAKDFARIKINQGNEQQYLDKTTTIWLGHIDSDQNNRQPFGWALVEIEPEKDCESLKAWCEQESLTYPDLEKERQRIEKEREDIRRKKQEEAAKEREREEKRRQELKKQQEEEARRAAMSELDRTLLDLTAILNKVSDKGGAGSQEAAQCREILEWAAANWQDAAEKKKLATEVASKLKKKNLTSKKFKEVLQRLRGES